MTVGVHHDVIRDAEMLHETSLKGSVPKAICASELIRFSFDQTPWMTLCCSAKLADTEAMLLIS